MTQLFTPEMLTDPYPVYNELRVSDPVHWHEPFGAWVLTRYRDILSAFTDPRLSSRRAEPLKSLAAEKKLDPFFAELSCRMDFQDPPEHSRLRGLVSRAFTPRVVERLTAAVQSVVDDLIDQAIARGGPIDVMADLAVPLPTTVITQLLGANANDRDHLKHLCDVFVGFFKTVPSDTTVAEYERSAAAAGELRRYFRAVVADPPPQAWGHLLADLAAVDEADGGALTEDEWAANAILLLHAGNETTTNLIGNGLLALLRNREQLELLARRPELIQPAVEELLRYDSPIQFTYRVAGEEFDIDGTTIRRGDLVHLVVGSANRDAEQFPNPDQLDIQRQPNRHLAFGHGPHFCLGAPLTRLEAAVALTSLIRRFPDMEFADELPRFQNNYVLRGLVALPIAV
ncbi:cytochrome P450 [Mycobacterium simiae]|uniref:Cytochrome P450 n=1 Tax=Mycobacterium simiae TaxID=1784 RepID=A0A5B1BKI6_MYCSI|nr:cytochrome P450 [Mycobacterium simiae]KAA1247399.1 cytochrome P450 [Mycobacterium simiae]